jgi:hypothetical protein
MVDKKQMIEQLKVKSQSDAKFGCDILLNNVEEGNVKVNDALEWLEEAKNYHWTMLSGDLKENHSKHFKVVVELSRLTTKLMKLKFLDDTRRTKDLE